MKLVQVLDANHNQILNFVVQTNNGAPGSAVTGQMYFDTGTQALNYYNGSTWQTVGTSSGSGTVTSVSVVSANGFTGSVANPGTTPAITITTSITGLLKGNGTAISAASAGTDYLAPTGSGASLTGITVGQVSGAAPLVSPAITGTPTAPTASNGTNTTQIATTAFVTSAVTAAIQGLDTKASAVVVSTSNVALSGLLTIDGVTLTAGQRVLLTGQTTTSQNGLWAAASGAWTRTADFASGSVQNGTFVFIESGTSGANSGWTLSGAGNVTVDTTAQVWVQFSGAGEITAGTGLSKSGNTLSVSTIPVANGGTNATSASAARTNLSSTSSALPQMFQGTVPSGSTSATITHNLGNQYPVVTVYEVSSGLQILCDVTATSTTVTTLGFAVAPTSGQYTCTIVG